MKNYNAIKSKIILLIFLLSIISCATNMTQDQITRETLNTVKNSWIEIRTIMINKEFHGEVSDTEMVDFMIYDKSFTFYYDAALTLYLSSSPNNNEYNTAIDNIRDLILKARKKYIN